MVGGTGNDFYQVDNAGDVVVELTGEGAYDGIASTVSYVLPANVETLTLLGAAVSATGNTDPNVISGNSGDNRLDGGAGADTLNGGGGNDTYVVDNVGDIVNAGSNGIDTIESSIIVDDAKQFVENLTLTGTAALNATGNASANVITGNAGANRLDGGGTGSRHHGRRRRRRHLCRRQRRRRRSSRLAGGGNDAVESQRHLHARAPRSRS